MHRNRYRIWKQSRRNNATDPKTERNEIKTLQEKTIHKRFNKLNETKQRKKKFILEEKCRDGIKMS